MEFALAGDIAPRRSFAHHAQHSSWTATNPNPRSQCRASDRFRTPVTDDFHRPHWRLIHIVDTVAQNVGIRQRWESSGNSHSGKKFREEGGADKV